MTNLLADPVIAAKPLGRLSLPGLLAALSAGDRVASFPALRPHQEPAWHMFLVQLAALSLHAAGRQDLPVQAGDWTALLRALTPGFDADEPWRLAVADWSRPAFLQPPVPDGIALKNTVPSPDALDLLITSRNHDLKQTVARAGEAQDWLFALVSLQTGEGYGGAGNHGIARMNGGSSSRALLSLAPLPEGDARSMSPRPGAWFRRNVRVLLETRDRELADSALDYPARGGLALVWLAPWPESATLRTADLDLWFIEACRRVRLVGDDTGLSARKGTSKAPRIDAKALNGMLQDPWAPVHVGDAKSFTLAGRDFDYRLLIDLLFTGSWSLPLLARPATFEPPGQPMLLVCAALARGNSKTEGFKSRILPLGGRIAHALGPRRQELHELAKRQAETVNTMDKALSGALALAAADGSFERLQRDHYAHARVARDHLQRYADTIFFEHLWKAFDARETDAEAALASELGFAAALWRRTRDLFEKALPAVPCAGLYRPRAEARASRLLPAPVRKAFPELFEPTSTPDAADRMSRHAV